MYSLYVLAIKRGCFFLHELRQPTVTYRRKFRSLNKTLRQVNAASQHSLYRGPRERARTLCAHHGRASAPPMTHTTSSKFPRHPPPTHPSPRPRLHPRRHAPPPASSHPKLSLRRRVHAAGVDAWRPRRSPRRSPRRRRRRRRRRRSDSALIPRLHARASKKTAPLRALALPAPRPALALAMRRWCLCRSAPLLVLMLSGCTTTGVNYDQNPPTHPLLPYVATPFLPYVSNRILFDRSIWERSVDSPDEFWGEEVLDPP